MDHCGRRRSHRYHPVDHLASQLLVEKEQAVAKWQSPIAQYERSQRQRNGAAQFDSTHGFVGI